jgi:heterodisulfide reductase subunit B
MKYLYYPGCSLKGTNRAYEESVLASFQALGIPVEELEDWNCCGATAYMAVDEMKSFALAARNLRARRAPKAQTAPRSWPRAAGVISCSPRPNIT